jgi:hypothetical protein
MDSHREIPGLVPNRPKRSGRREVRSLDAATMRVISPPPPPEEVFIDWLMSVPHDADLEAAARCKIALIDRRGLMHPDVFRLRTLLAVLAGTGAWPKHISNL